MLAVDRSVGGSVDPTGIIGLLLAVAGVYLTAKPPRKLLVVWVLSPCCLAAAAWLILTFFSVSIPVRIVVCAVLLVAYVIRVGVTRARVSKPHRSELNRILDTADEAIKGRKSMVPDEQQSSVLSCH